MSSSDSPPARPGPPLMPGRHSIMPWVRTVCVYVMSITANNVCDQIGPRTGSEGSSHST
jgi:hypothetical protein